MIVTAGPAVPCSHFRPNDAGGYLLCGAADLCDGTLEERLRASDPAWTWGVDRRYRPAAGGDAQLPMWHKCRIERLPHVGRRVGTVDRSGHEL